MFCSYHVCCIMWTCCDMSWQVQAHAGAVQLWVGSILPVWSSGVEENQQETESFDVTATATQRPTVHAQLYETHCMRHYADICRLNARQHMLNFMKHSADRHMLVADSMETYICSQIDWFSCGFMSSHSVQIKSFCRGFHLATHMRMHARTHALMHARTHAVRTHARTHPTEETKSKLTQPKQPFIRNTKIL